jgi:hypothetical protein
LQGTRKQQAQFVAHRCLHRTPSVPMCWKCKLHQLSICLLSVLTGMLCKELSLAQGEQLVVMLMMILHQMRHGWQDNHATNHVRCKKRAQVKANQKACRGINKAKPYTSETCGVQRLPSKAVEKHPVNAYGGKATAMHGRKGTWMRTNKKG